ncbi:FAD-dependent oxidoreductase [Clostridium sp. BNL1100]|uniref:FAD-dependent oxidoreductase n=1 Tax=Clostridium sp. BNL1100 TaxID=755731 RepID=UPI00024A7863|nr:FAD-dependent oxidoreductase [Clostridium sp. BNL1100]AEY67399.1 Thi4 family [Clostridium sp. BNL1100]
MFINENEKKIQVIDSYDVIVCGGGPSGIIAAIAAARNGAKTLLIERYGFVGGMASSALVTPISIFKKKKKLIIDGIPFELMKRISDLNGADVTQDSGNVPVDDEMFKLAAQQLLLESGVTLLYHTYFSDCVMTDGKVSHVIVQNKAGRVAYECKAAIDCTGDADLVRAAGFETTKETKLQPASLWFQLGGVDTDALKDLFVDAVDEKMPISSEIRGRLSELNQKGEMPIFGGPWISRHFRDGIVTINLLRESTDASSPEQFTRTECSLRENLFKVINIMRENFPAFKDCWLLKSGTQAGVRETYRIIGMYKMTADDVLNPKQFKDTIAKGTHVIDIHKPDSIEQDCISLKQEYNIPYGVLVPVNSENLITAGRCVCADNSAFGSIRVMATCMAMGQAAGTAAAISLQNNCSMSGMDTELLVKKLIEQGAII